MPFFGQAHGRAGLYSLPKGGVYLKWGTVGGDETNGAEEAGFDGEEDAGTDDKKFELCRDFAEEGLWGGGADQA